MKKWINKKLKRAFFPNAVSLKQFAADAAEYAEKNNRNHWRVGVTKDAFGHTKFELYVAVELVTNMNSPQACFEAMDKRINPKPETNKVEEVFI